MGRIWRDYLEGLLERLLLREKPTRALLAVGEMDLAYAALVAKQIDSTFPHTSSILSQLERHGLIRSRPEGRIRYLELTEQGRKVSHALKGLMDLLGEPGRQWMRLDMLRRVINSNDGPSAAFRLGPLRRDLMNLRSSGDKDVAKVAEELDRLIQSKIR
jgi:DNA-binding MarR family transcriptional regulator